MHRTDADSNVANLFVDPVPGTTTATQVDAPWLNAVQEEICNLLEGLGVTLVKATRTQLRDALGPDAVNGTLLKGMASFSGSAGGRARLIMKGAASNATEFWITVNASWNAAGSTWTKDSVSAPSLAIRFTTTALSPWPNAIAILRYNGGSGFATSAWLSYDNDAALQPLISRQVTVAPTLLNSWVNVGGALKTAGYFIDINGRVGLEGTIKDGVAATIFTLPITHRPGATCYFPVQTISGSLGIIAVDANGDVRMVSAVSAQVSMDGINFGK